MLDKKGQNREVLSQEQKEMLTTQDAASLTFCLNFQMVRNLELFFEHSHNLVTACNCSQRAHPVHLHHKLSLSDLHAENYFQSV